MRLYVGNKVEGTSIGEKYAMILQDQLRTGWCKEPKHARSALSKIQSNLVKAPFVVDLNEAEASSLLEAFSSYIEEYLPLDTPRPTKTGWPRAFSGPGLSHRQPSYRDYPTSEESK